MIQRLKSAWARHPIMTTGFLLAVVLTVVFAVRNVLFLVYWTDPKHRDQPIEGWMTPRYIVNSRQLKRKDILDIIGDGRMPEKRHTLEEIARGHGIPMETLILDLTTALDAHCSILK